ncbi:hypothetical protein L6452_01710 [Arctium lappa]|uniref:Uncharacterized protein n=1 Tax=Arctium lappa TaxID=4217 RepID=A0ACB9FHM7_ARCLA|nr:hypothetical protein L6452_01710 [Arctium lappa]
MYLNSMSAIAITGCHVGDEKKKKEKTHKLTRTWHYKNEKSFLPACISPGYPRRAKTEIHIFFFVRAFLASVDRPTPLLQF